MVAKRYGKRPSEILIGRLDAFGFDLAVALLSIDAEARARQEVVQGLEFEGKNKMPTRKDGTKLTPEMLFGKENWSG